jgi:hypothetical protein
MLRPLYAHVARFIRSCTLYTYISHALGVHVACVIYALLRLLAATDRARAEVRTCAVPCVRVRPARIKPVARVFQRGRAAAGMCRHTHGSTSSARARRAAAAVEAARGNCSTSSNHQLSSCHCRTNCPFASPVAPAGATLPPDGHRIARIRTSCPSWARAALGFMLTWKRSTNLNLEANCAFKFH